MRPRILIALFILLAGAHTALADVRVRTTPTSAIPGAPVVVTVTGSRAAPDGTAGETKLHFFRVRGGYRAVVAIPLDQQPGAFAVKVDGVRRPSIVTVRDHAFPESDVAVDDELANPDGPHRAQIANDNRAIRAALAKSSGAPQFVTFRRPGRGRVTSTFGEWRTFNAGHRSQHLGLDLGAHLGSPVHASATGTVALVRDCFLAGKVVVIDHGAGIATAYFHLASIDVLAGQRVVAGTRIGAAGDTGRATGAHLHLGVWVPGGFVDPAAFLKLGVTGR